MSTTSDAVTIERDVEMTSRDGVILRADVYHPAAPGRYPVLLMRTPYGKSGKGRMAQHPEARFYPLRGYVLVIQDVRGRGRSDGEFFPFLREGPDGYDAVEWAAGLPWSNGVVGTTGQSYLASAQYALAPLAPPGLRAMSPVAGGASPFRTTVYRSGVFELAWRLAYFVNLERESYVRAGTYSEHRARLDSYVVDPAVPMSPLTDEAIQHLPIRDWGTRLRGQLPYLADFIAHSADGPYWKESDIRTKTDRIGVPMLHIGSWYDAFVPDTLGVFEGVRRRAPNDEIRRAQRLLMGPWAHLQPYSQPTTGKSGEIDFGPDAAIELFQSQLRWFDRWLKGERNGLDDEPPVRIFVMGVNRWRDEDDWPLVRAHKRRIHLRHGEHTGALSWEPPGDDPPDRFTYDPNDPVPTCGGQYLGDGCGVADQRRIMFRPDVLVYVGPTLTEPMEVTGAVSMDLWAASSAPDTDFVAKLVDVHPDGFAQNVVDGIVRARFRESLVEPTPIVPGEVVHYTIDLRATSHVFLAKHRVAVLVSSSDFPRYDRNANSGLPFADDITLSRADQTIFHDRQRPSAVVLTVVPGGRGALGGRG